MYRRDPSICNDPPVLHYYTHQNRTGSVRTSVLFGKLQLPAGWNRDELAGLEAKQGAKCLPYYVAGYSGTRLTSLDCLKIQPTWMSLQPQLLNVPLKDIFIPGRSDK